MKNFNLTQQEAFEILKRNEHLCGGKDIVFDKTTNYVGILRETNLHRANHGAEPLK